MIFVDAEPDENLMTYMMATGGKEGGGAFLCDITFYKNVSRIVFQNSVHNI